MQGVEVVEVGVWGKFIQGNGVGLGVVAELVEWYIIG